MISDQVDRVPLITRRGDLHKPGNICQFSGDVCQYAWGLEILACLLRDAALRDIAWLFSGSLPAGWPLVQAVCDLVHQHIRFDYQQARADRTALDAYRKRDGVCRDEKPLAITFCRSLNIPARYCTGQSFTGTFESRRQTLRIRLV